MNYSTCPPKHHFHPGQRPQDGFKVISLLIFWSPLLLCLGATMMQLFSTSHDETVPERMFPNPVPPSLSMTSTLESSAKGFVPHNHPENESALLVEACTKVGSVDATPSFPRQRLQKVGAFQRMNTYCQRFLSIPCPGHIGRCLSLLWKRQSRKENPGPSSTLRNCYNTVKLSGPSLLCLYTYSPLTPPQHTQVPSSIIKWIQIEIPSSHLFQG